MSLKRLRLRAGFTQRQLADRVGVDHSFISLLEAGKRDVRNLAYGLVMRLAQALGVPPEQLLIGPVTTRPRRRRKEGAAA